MDPSATTSTRCATCFAELTSAESCPACAGQGTSRSSLLALRAGVLLAGQYRVGQVLGQPGGFGITYLAWDEKLETRVAIKEFFPRDLAGRGTDRATVQPHTQTDGSTFEFGLARFLEEARTLARFDHPNIVRVRNFFEANGTGYLVMDYYEGESLSAYLARQPGERLDEELAIRIMLPVLDGLRAVHAQGILHRDIDPHNIYLTTHGRVILLDFGAARMAVGDRSRSLSVILKPGYAPYEQYASTGKQGPWTDVYACAATLYRMLTGRTPVDAPSRIIDDTLAPPHEVAPGVSPRLSASMQRGLALRAEERPQTAEELQRLLVGGRESSRPRGANLRLSVPLTKKEAAAGARKKLKVRVLDSCRACGGSGEGQSGTAVRCTVCDGTGELRHVERSALGELVTVTPCAACGGAGRRTARSCHACDGRRVKRVEKTFEVNLRPGVSVGDHVRLQGQGDAGERGGERGDLVVVIAAGEGSGPEHAEGVEAAPARRSAGRPVDTRFPVGFRAVDVGFYLWLAVVLVGVVMTVVLLNLAT